MADRKTVYHPRAKAGLQFVFDNFGAASPAVGPSLPEDLNVPLRVGFDGDLTPKSMQIHLTGYREADTFSVEFDARRVPFTPEVIRAGEANLWLYQLLGMDEAFDGKLNDQTLRLRGLFDNVQFRGGDGGRWFSGDGRDYTCLLIDKKWTPQSGHGGRVQVGHDLVETVQGLVDEAIKRNNPQPIVVRSGSKTTTIPNTLKVVFRGGGEPPRVDSVSKGVTQRVVTEKPPIVGQGHARTHKAGMPVRSDRSYWDVIYMLCIKHGFICYVRGAEIIIGKPQTLTREQGGDLYHMVLGRNLKTLVVERHLAKEAVPQIVAVSYDPRTKQTLEARYPEQAQERITGVNTVKEEVRFVEAGYGITDKALLRDVAQTYYYHLARGEGKIHWSTRDLTDLSEDEKDLLQLDPGKPVTIGFNDFDERSFRELSSSERERLLLRLGYEAQVANVLALQYERIPRDPYYAKSVSYSWDVNSGIDISCEQINFISVRRDGAGLPTTPVARFTSDKPSARGPGRVHRGPLRAR